MSAETALIKWSEVFFLIVYYLYSCTFPEMGLEHPALMWLHILCMLCGNGFRAAHWNVTPHHICAARLLWKRCMSNPLYCDSTYYLCSSVFYGDCIRVDHRNMNAQYICVAVCFVELVYHLPTGMWLHTLFAAACFVEMVLQLPTGLWLHRKQIVPPSTGKLAK